jgi:hypothetical protein
MFNQELGSGSSRTETYYRKALVAKMTFGNNGQTVTATSEEYSRSTVGRAAATKQINTVSAKAQGTKEQRSALEVPPGDDEPMTVDEEDEFAGLDAGDEEGPVQQQQQDEAEPQQEQQEQQQQQHLAATTAKAAALGSEPLTVTVSGLPANGDAGVEGEQQDADVLAAMPAATVAAAGLDQAASDADSAISQGGADAAASQQAKQELPEKQQQQQQQQQQSPKLSLAEAAAAWWSDIISADGDRLPKVPKKDRDVSASLATAGALWLRMTPTIFVTLLSGQVAVSALLAARPDQSTIGKSTEE